MILPQMEEAVMVKALEAGQVHRVIVSMALLMLHILLVPIVVTFKLSRNTFARLIAAQAKIDVKYYCFLFDE